MNDFKSLADEVKRTMPLNFQQRIAALKAKAEDHPTVKALRSKYPDHDIFTQDLFHYAKNCDCCTECTGLDSCSSDFYGQKLFPVEDGQRIVFRNHPCDLLLARELRQQIEKNVKSHFVPEHILAMTFEKLEKDVERKQAIAEAMRFCVSYKRGETKQGVYLHGPMGTGKSAIAGAMCQELAKRSVDVVMVFLPDFLGEIKSAIKTGEVESKLDAMRSVSVLILDDIGAEPLTIWTRDEVLGPILQRRMERLPTIFTSNLTINELKAHIARVKDEQRPNETKAARLIERIEPFVKIVKVGGKNRRRE